MAGTPSKNESTRAAAHRLAGLGLNAKQIACELNVTTTTIFRALKLPAAGGSRRRKDAGRYDVSAWTCVGCGERLGNPVTTRCGECYKRDVRMPAEAARMEEQRGIVEAWRSATGRLPTIVEAMPILGLGRAQAAAVLAKLYGAADNRGRR